MSRLKKLDKKKSSLYRTLDCNFWTDTKIMDHFDMVDKYFYLYLMTNPMTNLCGCYEISKREIETETRLERDQIDEKLSFLCDMGVVETDGNEILLLNRLKHNWTGSNDFAKGIYKECSTIKSTRLLLTLLNKMVSDGIIKNEDSILEIQRLYRECIDPLGSVQNKKDLSEIEKETLISRIRKREENIEKELREEHIDDVNNSHSSNSNAKHFYLSQEQQKTFAIENGLDVGDTINAYSRLSGMDFKGYDSKTVKTEKDFLNFYQRYRTVELRDRI